MQHSESIANLGAALAKAQKAMENPHKNATNPQVKKKYADLAEVINTVRPVLADHGLSVVQFPGFDGEKVSVETVLLHESGEWMSGTSLAPLGIQYAEGGRVLPPSPQAVGMSITYLRRYSLAAVTGVAQEDDDAVSAQSSGTPAEGTSSGPTTPVPTCPQCDGPMWDNREGKKNPKSPDFKCKKKECEGVYWPGDWPPAGEGALAEVAAEMDRLVGGVKVMIQDLSGLNAERSDKAQAALDNLLTAENATPEAIRRLGSQVLAVLKEEQTAAAAALATAGVAVAADGQPIDDDLPF